MGPLPYSSSNFSTKSLVFPKFSLSFLVSSFTIYFFYHTRYLSFPLLLNTISTLYSSSPSITTGREYSFCCPSTWSLYFCTLLTAGYIFTVSRSSNSVTFVKIILLTWWSPTNHSISFSDHLLCIWDFRSLMLKSTQLHTVYFSGLLLFLSAYFLISSSGPPLLLHVPLSSSLQIPLHFQTSSSSTSQIRYADPVYCSFWMVILLSWMYYFLLPKFPADQWLQIHVLSEPGFEVTYCSSTSGQARSWVAAVRHHPALWVQS